MNSGVRQTGQKLRGMLQSGKPDFLLRCFEASFRPEAFSLPSSTDEVNSRHFDPERFLALSSTCLIFRKICGMLIPEYSTTLIRSIKVCLEMPCLMQVHITACDSPASTHRGPVKLQGVKWRTPFPRPPQHPKDLRELFLSVLMPRAGFDAITWDIENKAEIDRAVILLVRHSCTPAWTFARPHDPISTVQKVIIQSHLPSIHF